MAKNVRGKRPSASLIQKVKRVAAQPGGSESVLADELGDVAKLVLDLVAYCEALESALDVLGGSSPR
jgi:hypothetical protein